MLSYISGEVEITDLEYDLDILQKSWPDLIPDNTVFVYKNVSALLKWSLFNKKKPIIWTNLCGPLLFQIIEVQLWLIFDCPWLPQSLIVLD